MNADRRKERRLTEPKGRGKPAKPARTLEDEIAEAEARLKALRQKQQQEKEQREREGNLKAILTLLQEEGLDAVAVQHWRAVLPRLHEMLMAHAPDAHDAGQAEEAL
jgi:hypothetical protein